MMSEHRGAAPDATAAVHSGIMLRTETNLVCWKVSKRWPEDRVCALWNNVARGDFEEI